MRRSIVGLLCAVACESSLAAAPVKNVVIPAQIAFTNAKAIDAKVRAECQLPQRQAELLAEALRKAGIEPKVVKNAKPSSGANVLQLEIEQAVSAGHAGLGHYKYVTVKGRLFQGGKRVASFVSSRRSGGGAFGYAKGSCAVLGRCAQAVSQDVARWLRSPVDGAKLGDAR